MIGPYLYDRGVTFSGMLANRPGKFENLNLFKEHQVKFAQRMRNCEDVLIEEGMGVAFVSCNPGRDQWNTVMVRITSAAISQGGLARTVDDRFE